MPHAGWMCCLALGAWVAATAAQEAQPASASLPPQRCAVGAPVELPLRAGTMIPAVEARINGEPFVVAIDLGSAGSLQPDAALVEKLKLPLVGRKVIFELGADQPAELECAGVQTVTLGDARFEGIEGPVRDLADFWPGMERVYGVLGADLFRECLVTIDYPAGKLRIESGELPAVDGQEVLALVVGQPVPAVELRIGDGPPTAAHLDTGSVTGISLTPALAAELKFSSPLRSLGEVRGFSQTGQLQQGRLVDSIALGRHQLQTPIVTVIDFLKAANLGTDVLRHFAVTLDLKHGRARLSRAGSEPITFTARYLVGVMLQRSQNQLLVERVIPGSAAEAAGLETGDLIVSVNGKPLAKLEASELRNAFARPEPVRLQLEREGKTLEVVVTPRRSDE